MSKSTQFMFLDKLVTSLRPYWFRGKGLLLKALTPENRKVRAQIFGYEMALDLSDEIQRNIYLGTFEPHETALLIKYLEPGMTILDVGANVGYFTALAASRVGDNGKVYSLEPSPYVFSQLEKMIQKNKIA